MARLNDEQWEKARAEYEVRGVSLGEVAKLFGVATSSVSRRARAEGWTQGKMQDLVERKVAAAKEIHAVETQMQEMPLRFRMTFDDAVQERLNAEGLLARLDATLAHRGALMAQAAATPQELELLSRVSRNIRPQAERAPQTTVNVTQQQASSAQTGLSPRDALAEIVRQSMDADDCADDDGQEQRA